MKAYKGFDRNLKCRDFQYKEGGEYETDEAKLREALETLRELLGDLLRLGDAEYHDDFSNFCDIIDAALAAPPRNCDRFASAEEAWDAYDAWVESYREKGETEPLNEFGWLFTLAAEKEGGKDGNE